MYSTFTQLLERAAKVIKDDTIAAQMNDLPDTLKPMVKVVDLLLHCQSSKLKQETYLRISLPT